MNGYNLTYKIKRKVLLRTIRKCRRGQSFIEFLFLLLVLIGMSLVMIKGFNGGIGERWRALVEVISAPSSDTVELR